jgi:hypothetical protein
MSPLRGITLAGLGKNEKSTPKMAAWERLIISYVIILKILLQQIFLTFKWHFKNNHMKKYLKTLTKLSSNNWAQGNI